MAVLKDFTKFMLAPVAEAFFFRKVVGLELTKVFKKKRQGCFPVILRDFPEQLFCNFS